MPTKPSDTFELATNAVYAGGPFTGQPTKQAPPVADGYVPGVVIAAEHHNYIGNICGQWITDWLSLGSFDPDLDAHIIETDSNGVATIAGLTLGNTALADNPLEIAPNAGVQDLAQFTVDVGNVGAAFLVADGGLAGITMVCSGAAPGIIVASEDGGGVAASSTGTANAISAIATGSGDAVRGQAEGAATAGVHGLSSVLGNANYGVWGEAQTASNVGGFFTQNNPGAGPDDSSSAALVASADEGLALYAKSNTGYAAVLAGTLRPSLRLSPAAQPSFFADGDLWNDTNLSRYGAVQNGTAVVKHASSRGYSGGVTDPVDDSKTNTGTTKINGTELSLPDYEAPTVAGHRLHLSASMLLRNGNNTIHRLTVQIYDSSALDVVVERQIYLAQTYDDVTDSGAQTDCYERHFSLDTVYAVPSAGARNFEIRVAVEPTGGAGVEMSQVILKADGSF